MTRLAAVLSFLKGVEIYRRRAAVQLAGSPYMLRLRYEGGHPGIWSPAPFWVGRVDGQIRLVDEHGERCYDLPVDRIRGLTYAAGQVALTFEPTAGLVTSVTFSAADGPECYRQLQQLVLPSA